MSNLRRLIRTTLIGGVLFLIPLVFVVVVVGKAFQIMKVVATPLAKLIPAENYAGYAVVELLTVGIMILGCLLVGTLARSPWGRKVNEKLDAVLLQMIPGYAWVKGITGGIRDNAGALPPDPVPWRKPMKRFVIAVFVLALFLSPAELFAQGDCQADIRGTVKRKENTENHTKYTVKIDVSAQMKCAVVRFDIVVIEEDPAGEKFEVRIPKKVKIRDSRTVTQKFDYKLKKGQAVVDHRFEQSSCVICD